MMIMMMMMMMMIWQDKFLTSQLDIVTSDPGKALAWLVLVSTVITFLLGHLVYLALFGLLYITWLYGDNLSLNSRDRDVEEEDEEEWLLDRFFCFLQQLDNGGLKVFIEINYWRGGIRGATFSFFGVQL